MTSYGGYPYGGYQPPPPVGPYGPPAQQGYIWPGYRPNMSIVDTLPPEMHYMVPEVSCW